VISSHCFKGLKGKRLIDGVGFSARQQESWNFKKVKIEDEAGQQRRMTVHPSRFEARWFVGCLRSTSACWWPVLSHKQVVDVTCPLWWRFEAWEVIKDMDKEKDGLGCYNASRRVTSNAHQLTLVSWGSLAKVRLGAKQAGHARGAGPFAGRLANKTQPHNDNIDA